MKPMGPRSCRKPRTGDAGGYSLLEMLVVLAIAGMMMLVSVPNLLRWHETYLLKADARTFANGLKLGRMKAVANNVSFGSELDSTLRTQCSGQTGGNRPSVVVVYQDGTSKVEECFPGTRRLAAAVLGTSVAKVVFKPNGMAVKSTGPDVPLPESPNRYKITSRNKKVCQLVCVNTTGAVQLGPVLEGTQCTTPPTDCNIP